ncbi:unnamed protein product [Ambrosiozyma monospora]|uniref:Unnamed protein product n=1 Tax=Ambrosiozyma monospora TaxID=43982 RepID=A0A9W6YZA2_AMBMO|nr:unnamed protein product [Ambrosiozyma monospora]
MFPLWSVSASTTTRTVVPTYLVPANNVRELSSTASITAWAQLESLTSGKTSSPSASSTASVSTSVYETNSVVSVGSNTLPVTYASYSQNPSRSSTLGQVSSTYKSAITIPATTEASVFSELVAHKAIIYSTTSSDSTSTVSSPATSSTIFGAGVDRAAGAASVSASASASESISSVPALSSVSDSSANRSLQITGIFGALISFLVFIF